MRWQGREKSKNIEDRRGIAPKVAMGGGLMGIVVVLGMLLFNLDPQTIQKFLNGKAQQQPAGKQKPADDHAGKFVAVILKDTENVWGKLFKEELNSKYREPKLTLYNSSVVVSGCGRVPSTAGPFYCPADQTIYINPAFFDELKTRHKAGGDFAAAYVIAHEVAHHVQFLMGFSDRVNRIRARKNKIETNRASVRLELQADYLAGVWAHHLQKDYRVLETGDIGEAINAENQIGDDKLQKKATGYVMPERFTHGTSKQREYWFKQGMQTGNFQACRVLFEIRYEDL